MEYKFFLVDAETAKDPTKLGYSYAKLHKSEWISGGSNFDGNITTGVAKGIDNVVYNDTAYQIYKLYFDVDDKSLLVICIESTLGCDVKEVF